MFTRALRHARTPRSRKLGGLAVALALIAAPLMLLPSAASADSGSGLSGSPFNGADGVLDSTPAVSVTPDSGTGNADNSYTQGAKENDICPTVESGSIPPSKADLSNLYVGTAKGSNGHTFLYLGWSRTDTNGTVTLDFELNQATGQAAGCTNGVNPARTAGDVLVTYDFQGGKVDALQYRLWDGSEWGDPVGILSGAEGSINLTTLKFGEMAIDLEAAGIFTPGVCQNFASQLAKSRASDSFQAEMKDFIGPGRTQITNCGSLTVTKTVVGGAGESFSFTVDCGSYDLNGTENGTELTFTLGNGGSRKIDDIPLGTTCSVTETDPGGTRWTTTHTVAGGSSQSGLTASGIAIALGNKTVAFTNTRKVGNLVVNKTTEGGTGTFTFHVDCTVDAFDQTFTITNTGSKTISNIPTETSCTVSEDSNQFFTSVRVPENGTVAIDTDGETVSFTNTRKVGDLVIQKTTSGGTGTFTFNVNCTDDAFDRTVTITGTGSKTIEDIPTGTICTVLEVTDPLFDSNSDPSDGTVTIDENGETVSFTNTRKVGDLVIEKVTLGGSGTFTFDVNCDDNRFDRTVTITGSDIVRIENIPTGTSCTVNEIKDPLFDSTSDPAGGTVVIDTGDNTVSFLNTRKIAGLTINKLTTGETGTYTFTFRIDCDGDTFDKTVTIDNTGSYTLIGIPTGTHCTVTEDEHRLFTSASVPADGEVTIDDDGASVSFTNVRKVGDLVIQKTTSGGTGTFTFHVDCTGDSFDDTFTITGSGEVTIQDIPTETECTVTEDEHDWFNSSVDDGTVVIDTDGATVRFTNTTKPNGISIDKKVNGVDTSSGDPLAVEVGSTLTYTIKVTNSGEVPLSISELTDTLKADVGATCVPSVDTSLRPGESVLCTYTMTAADPGGASIVHNTAAAEGIDIFERPAGPVDDETFVHVLNPAIHLEKDGPSSAHVGDTITYTLTVTNPGNTPLAIVDWEDDICNNEPALKTKEGEDNRLDPGETWVYTCTHVVVAADPDRLVNTATVTGMDDLEAEVDDTDDAVTDILRPAIDITKTGTTTAHVGDAVVYTLVVTNQGNTPLASVTVSDPKCDGPAVRATVDAEGLLSPGEAWTYHCTHIATAADGTSILNTARAEGTDPLGKTVNSTDDHTALVLHPAITIVKTASPELVAISGPVTYLYVVTNTGDATLHDVVVTDDILGAIGSVGELAPGQSITMAKTVVVDASTPPRNIGTVVGTDPLGKTVSANDDAVIAVVLGEVLVQPELPRTGAPLQAQAWAALAMIQVGIVLNLAGRRRRGARWAD